MRASKKAKPKATPKPAAERNPPENAKPVPVADEKSVSPVEPCPVAGFGASAGGLEAFTELLGRLPENPGAAFVLVQHLDPRHSSILRDLLARATKMTVLQATNGMRIEPNRVYVIPPNASLTVSGPDLKVAPRRLTGQHMPVDELFRSLAKERGSRAIGVVLSGTASDGTLGLRAIKAEGGITLVQSPDTAKYDGIDEEERRERPDRFQWPLAAAFALWILELCRIERRR